MLIFGPFWVIFGPFWQFWVIFGPCWAILGHFRAMLGNFGSFLDHFFGANFFWPKIYLWCYFYYFLNLWRVDYENDGSHLHVPAVVKVGGRLASQLEGARRQVDIGCRSDHQHGYHDDNDDGGMKTNQIFNPTQQSSPLACSQCRRCSRSAPGKKTLDAYLERWFFLVETI